MLSVVFFLEALFPSSTMADPVLQSPTNPHFFQNIPVKFLSAHIEGRNQANTVKLRSDSSEKTWKVKRDGRSRLSFTKGNKMAGAGREEDNSGLDKHRVEWPVNVAEHNGNGRMQLGEGIINFFNATGFKLYEFFQLELVWEDRTSLPVLKFCSKIKT